MDRDEDLSVYDEPGLATRDAKVPFFLKMTYIIFPIWGVVWFFLFWNGNVGGWFDRGYWYELQVAANTTFPIENQNMPQHPEWQEFLGEEESLAE